MGVDICLLKLCNLNIRYSCQLYFNEALKKYATFSAMIFWDPIIYSSIRYCIR